MIRIQENDFNTDEEYRALCAAAPEAGAVVFFVGRVRGRADSGSVEALELEHYPGMCERQLQGLINEIRSCWPCEAVHLVHRVGRLEPGEEIVYVGVASRHRHAAIEATHFLMDQLKTRAPFWKKEHGVGNARWLTPPDADLDAARSWYSRGLCG